MNTPANSGGTALKYGAGQLSPAKARDPGLVYDASEGDYVTMLCAQGYNATQLALVTGSNATACPGSGGSGSGGDLNYPTMAARVEPGKNFTVRFPRTVTNAEPQPAPRMTRRSLCLPRRPKTSPSMSRRASWSSLRRTRRPRSP